MPTTSHPKPSLTKPRPSSHLSLPESGGRHDSRQSPAAVKRQKKKRKEVHWDSTAIDNEPKVKSSRPISPTKAKGLLVPALPSQRTQTPVTLFKKPLANTPVRLSRPSGHLPIDGRSPPTPQSAHRSSNLNPKISAQKYPIPPRVPDCPRALKPPPAPRPGRLPTPDLPPINGKRMFPPLPSGKNYNGPQNHHTAKAGYAKTNMDAQRKSPSRTDDDVVANRNSNSGGGAGVYAGDAAGIIVHEALRAAEKALVKLKKSW